jgi:hypothetical protein
MNIFVIDPDTTICAQALDDLRLNKMIIETAQLLSTAMRVQGYTNNDIYKISHVNHPCAVWTRETQANYKWLLLYMSDLVEERMNRTGKGHKSYEIFNTLCGGPKLMPPGDLTPWPNCTPNKHIVDIHDAYKITMRDKWANDKRPPKWTNSTKPSWA